MLIVCAIWGVNFSMLKLALRSFTPMGFSAIRFAVASLLLWLVARAAEPHAPPLPRRVLWRLAGLGVIGNTLYQVAFITGLTRTTAGNSALLIASTPLMTAVLGGLLGTERLTRAVGWAIGIGTLGVGLVVLSRETAFSLDTMAGDLLTLGAVLCWALFTHGVRAASTHASPLRVAAITTICGTPLLVLAGLPDLLALDWSRVTATAWSATAYATLLSTVVAFVLWNRSVHLIGGNRTALFGILVPLVTLATAALLLGEQPTAPQLVGAGLILGSVAVNVLVQRDGGEGIQEGV
jgi:drug/metabolite transporter (DMT)-like permease